VRLVQDPGELVCGHVGVDRRRLDARMPEELLDVAHVGAALQQVRRTAVAQRVGGHAATARRSRMRLALKWEKKRSSTFRVCLWSCFEYQRTRGSSRSASSADSKERSLRAMRAACRKFLEGTDDPDGIIVRYGGHPGHWGSWRFGGALGELRGVFGIHIARIAAQNGLDIEDDLGRILPASDIETDGRPGRKSARRKPDTDHD
jgi:hypothetical protein